MHTFFKRPLLHACGLFLVVFSAASQLEAQFKFREPPNRQDPASLDAMDGLLLWEAFRQNRYAGSFSLEGELVSRPAGAPSSGIDLHIEAEWYPPCNETVITFREPSPDPLRLTFEQCGSEYFLVEECNRKQLADDGLSEALHPKVPITLQDILMPYLEWEDVDYLGPDRFLGRPAHRYRLTAPAEDVFPASVIVTIDEDYAALLKAELFDVSGFSATRVRVGGFKQFAGEWMFSSLVWEDRRERSSIRLKVYSFSSTP